MIALGARCRSAVWIGLLVGARRLLAARASATRAVPAAPARWPSVVAVVPARDEADVIARIDRQPAAQDYPGDVPRSCWSTTAAATAPPRSPRARARATRLRCVTGAPLPAGWTGKLWAVSQGIAAAGAPDYLWLTDADIAHAPDTLRSLVARAEAEGCVLVSLMAKLRCDSIAETRADPRLRLLLPDAVPVRPGELRRRASGAAAGGCMLVRRDALERRAAIAAIRGALIDDCALGALLKRQGRVWLGLTDRSRSIRPYDECGRDRGDDLRARPMRSLATPPCCSRARSLGLALVYAAPPVLALFGSGVARVARHRRLGADGARVPADAALLPPLAALGRRRCR